MGVAVRVLESLKYCKTAGTPTPTLPLPLRGKGRERGAPAVFLPLAGRSLGEGRPGWGLPVSQVMTIPLHRNTDHAAVNNARRLRREMTMPERVLWARLRAGAVGHRFRRQHPFGPYVLDFYSPSLRLCVEVDGDDHSDRAERDAARDEALAAAGVRTIRIAAGDLMRDTDARLQWLWEECQGLSEAP